VNQEQNATPARLARRMAGIARHRAHNRELHELAQMRRYGGHQWGLPLNA